jgi:hypothetical protein
MTTTVTARADSALVEMRCDAAEAVRRGRNACDATHEQVAAVMCMSRTGLSQCAKPKGGKTLDIARAALAPEPLRLALAAFIAGPRHSLVRADVEHVRDLHAIVRELSDVMSVAATNEADGYVSPEEAERELAEWDDVERVMSARRDWLRRAQRERGLRVVGGVR